MVDYNSTLIITEILNAVTKDTMFLWVLLCNRRGLEIFQEKYASVFTRRYMWKKSFIFVSLNGLNFTFSIIHFTSFTQQITWLDALIADECEYNNYLTIIE